MASVDGDYLPDFSEPPFGPGFDGDGKFVSGYGLKDSRNPANPVSVNNERVFSMAQRCATVADCIAVSDQLNAEASRLYAVSADLQAKGYTAQAGEIAAMAKDADYASRVADSRAASGFNPKQSTWSDGVAGDKPNYSGYLYPAVDEAAGQSRASIGLSSGVYHPAVVNIPAASITPWSTNTVQGDPGTIDYEAGLTHELERDLNLFSLATAVPGAGFRAVNGAAQLWRESYIPYRFRGFDEFSKFSYDMRDGLARIGYSNTEPIIQGSAVTGRSFKTGQPFDLGRVSDFDIALADTDLLSKAADLGIGLRSGGTRTGPLSARDLRKLNLFELSNSMGTSVGREVNFMIYNSATSATQRAPSIILRKPGE